jgi:hypothetical protein
MSQIPVIGLCFDAVDQHTPQPVLPSSGFSPVPGRQVKRRGEKQIGRYYESSGPTVQCHPEQGFANHQVPISSKTPEVVASNYWGRCDRIHPRYSYPDEAPLTDNPRDASEPISGLIPRLLIRPFLKYQICNFKLPRLLILHSALSSQDSKCPAPPRG